MAAEELACLRGAVQRLRRRKSKRIAVFLGAGASANFGYPLTRDLLRIIIENINSPRFLAALDGDPPGTGKANRELLRDYLFELLPGESLSRDNLPLVTSLLSLLDYSIATGQSVLPGRSIEETRRARQLLERAILEAIDDEDWFKQKEEEQVERFCNFLRELRANRPSRPVGVITTNYDMAADIAVFQCSVNADKEGYWKIAEIATEVDFGFRWLDPESRDGESFTRPSLPQFHLYKLHGSTNWLRCPLCDNIYVNPWAPIWHQAYRRNPDEYSECHCSATQLEAQIVSPSFVREMREPNLLGVWKSALDLLREADEWVIVGYSFPDEDLGVRALFTRAYGARDRRPHITVVQYNRSSFPRYDSFFDPSELTFCIGGLSAFLEQWTEQAAATKARKR